MPFLLLYFSFLQQLDAKIESIKAFFFFTQRLEIYEISRTSFFLHSRQSTDHFTVVGSIYQPFTGREAEIDLVWIQTSFLFLWKFCLKNTSQHDLHDKAEGLYQNKADSSLVCIRNCKMDYSVLIQCKTRNCDQYFALQTIVCRNSKNPRPKVILKTKPITLRSRGE